MRSHVSQGASYDNRLLQSLDAQGRERFAKSLQRVTLAAQQVLFRAGDHIDEIYFPENAVICMLTVMEDGQTIESGTVGCEGASWVSASFDELTMPCQTTVAVGGDAFKIDVQLFSREIQLSVDFHAAVCAYSHALLIAAFRTTACNGLHSIHQRVARWMLTVLDRTSEERFQVTHEFLSDLLGVRRSTISEIVADLRDKGIIESSRGMIEIVKREELCTLACECYAIIKQNYNKLHPPGSPKRLG